MESIVWLRDNLVLSVMFVRIFHKLNRHSMNRSTSASKLTVLELTISGRFECRKITDMRFGLNMVLFRVTALLVFVGLALTGCTEKPDSSIAKFSQFDSIYEPSGIQWVPGSGIVLIEDEPELLPRLIAIGKDMSIQSSVPIEGLPVLDDLEGITVSPQGRVYLITSHSVKGNGRRDQAREKLLSFKLSAGVVSEVAVSDSNLADALLDAYPVVKEAVEAGGRKDRLNIEALAWNHANNSLLIGLRSPVSDGHALVAQLNNPVEFLTNRAVAQFDERLTKLDLHGGGIRSIEYDFSLKGYLVASRGEDKKNQPFQLWRWDGDVSARQLAVRSLSNLDKLEGVSPVVVDSKSLLMLVFDDGDAEDNRGGHYAIADYDLVRD